MIIEKLDNKYKFRAFFDTDTGTYARTGILDDEGNDTDVDPFMTMFPELIDVGIMGHCTHGLSGLCMQTGVQCYQSGSNINNPNMSLENYKKIVDECKGKTFQFALGGRGDVDQHENFIDILKYTRDCGIVPNFTSSGLGFNNEIVAACKDYCGAVAVSWYRQKYTYRAIDMLLEAGVKTNIHYVLGNNTIEEASRRLETGDFPKGINAVIFLLHKPIGLGEKSNVLQYDNELVKKFFQLVNKNNFEFQIGFDSCTIPGLINYATNIDPCSYDTCEAGRWSAYITSDMKMLPCSFDNIDMRWAYDISNDTIANAWNSQIFDDFRSYFKQRCISCIDREGCMGGCPICNDIVLCNRDVRSA